VIGYRNPFCGIFVKGAPPGSAAFGLDKHAQSKTIIRLEATVAFRAAAAAADGAGTVAGATGVPSATGATAKAEKKAVVGVGGASLAVELTGVKDERLLVTEVLGAPKAIGKKVPGVRGAGAPVPTPAVGCGARNIAGNSQ